MKQEHKNGNHVEKQHEPKELVKEEEHSFFDKFSDLICEEIVLLMASVVMSATILLTAGFKGQLPTNHSVLASAVIMIIGVITVRYGLRRRNKTKSRE